MNIKIILKRIVNSVKYIPHVNTRLPILFVHIPKTAGTSFRKAAEKSRRIKYVLCDYGKDNATTSPELNQARYYEKGDAATEHLLANNSAYILTGHFPVTRFQHYFYPYEIGTFIRNPIERVVSNYHHKQRNNGYEHSLETFLQTGAAKNLQAKQFGDLPLEYFGFIGISEKYEASIKHFNSFYGLDFKALSLNTNPNKLSAGYKVSKEIEEAISQQNQKEFAYYQRALKLHKHRVKFMGVKYPLYGSWYFHDKNTIIGRAYRAFTNKSVRLILTVNNKKISSTLACLQNPMPYDVKQPNNGAIGFVFNIPFSINDEDEVSVFAKDTKEPLFNFSTSEI